MPPKQQPPKAPEKKKKPDSNRVKNGIPTFQPKKGANAEIVKALNRALEMGVNGLRTEFRDLAKYTAPGMTVSAFLANHEAGKNRYQDVPCQDQNRVVLKWPGIESDYVHANYVATPWSDKRFICTQGPLDGTVNEFWVMVVQEEVVNIIMLCNTIEMGKNKCAQYWPANVGESVKLDAVGIEIRSESCEPMTPDEPNVILSKLRLTWDKGSREIRHYQWVNWPDRGVPPIKMTCMDLLMRVRGSKVPILVHCSAGIGRTGTVVAIEYILERLANGMEVAAMNELLKSLRAQRAFSIQNDMQYLYVHRILLSYFTERSKEKNPAFSDPEFQSKLKVFLEEYAAATGC